MNFFVIINTEQVGPCTMQQLMEMWQLKQISNATYYWREGLPDWLPLGSLVSDAIIAVEKLPPPKKAVPPTPPPSVTAPALAPVAAEPVKKATEPVIVEDAPAVKSSLELAAKDAAPAATIVGTPWSRKTFVWLAVLTVLFPLGGFVAGCVGMRNPATRKQGALLVEWAIVLFFVGCIAILLFSYR